MYKKITFLACLLFAFLSSRAAYNPVTLTGYNADIVLNGSATVNNTTPFPSVTAGADVATNPGPFTFYASDFAYSAGSLSGGPFTSGFMPAGGTISSSLTYGVPYQLAPYTANNALSLVGVTSGTLTFSTPSSGIGELYVMGVSGSAGSTITFTVNFSDGTNQVFSGNSFGDWGSSSTNNALIVGRIAIAPGTSSGLSQASTGFYFREAKLTLLPANYTKTIQSVTVANTTSTSVLSIMGITAATVCSSAAVAGTAQMVGGGTSVCPNTNFGLTLSGNSVGVGITYQWQSNNGSGWTNISGATTNPYTVTGGTPVPTQYRAYVACQASSANADTSLPFSLTLNPATQCYCTPTYSNGGSTDNIVNVVLGTLTNATTGNPSPYYTNYASQQPTPIAIPNLTVGQPYTLSLTFGSDGSQYNGVWIDFNQDGTFGTNEFFTSNSNAGSNGTANVTLNIPLTALPGNTRMRIRGGDDSQPTSSQSCGASNSSYGEAEDYLVNIVSLSPCPTPTAQPTSLTFTPLASTVSGSFTASSPTVDKYLIVRTPGAAALNTSPVNGVQYAIGSNLGNGTVISFGAATTLNDAGLSLSTQYTYTIFAVNSTATCGPTYLTTSPLTGSVTTTGANSYTWNATTGSADWTVAANWTPARTTPDPTDILLFTNGGTSTATNIPTQTVRRIAFGGNTVTNFQSAATATLTLASDNDATTYELNIPSGSSLVSNGTTAALTLAFSGTGGVGKIAGTLEVANTGTPVNKVDFSNAIDTVTATGTLAAGGTANGAVFTSTATNLVVMGTYNHKYTTAAGTVPTATWGTGSNTFVIGYTTAAAGPSGINQSLYNLTYNCPLQTVNNVWATVPTAVTGTFLVDTTGTAEMQWSSTSTVTLNNFSQTRGIFNMGTSGTAKAINVTGAFNQTKGLLKVSGAGAVTLNFNGTAAAQNVNFFDSAVTGPVIYQVTNAAGINLTGSGYFATNNAFKINTGGGVRISSIAANPIVTTLVPTYFATGTTLTYDAGGAIATTANIWPTTNGPLNVTVNMSATAPANRLTLSASRSVAGTFTLTNGVVVLGSNNLTIPSGGTLSVSTPGINKMISADGSGQLIRNISTTAAAYLFPIGDLTNGADYSPVNLNIVSNAAARNIGARVVNAHNPNDASTTNYLNRYWLFTDDGGTNAYSYNGSFTYPLTDVVGSEASMGLGLWNGTAWSQIPTPIPSGGFNINGIQLSTSFPLGGNQVTGRPAVATPNTVYSWIGNTTASQDFQVATNWSPTRNIIDVSDILQFNDNLVDTVKNIPSQTIARLNFIGTSTKAVFNAPAAATLTLQSDNNATTNELNIASGDSLLLNASANAITIAFSGTGSTANIAGQFEAAYSSAVHTLNLANCVTTVASTGVIAAGGNTGTATFTNASTANLIMNGTYNHKYTGTSSGPGVPIATWNTGSTVLISGYTTSTGGPNGGMNQTFYNFTYNCPAQTTTTNWSGTGPLTVTNNFTLVSTGSGTLQFATTQAYNYAVKNYIQSGGTLDVQGSTASGPSVLNISGDFTQTGGTLKAGGTGTTAANAATINFNGTATQNVTFNNVSSPTGPLVYRISNSNGINLVGAGSFTSLALNSNGGVRISTATANPINTTVNLIYGSGSTLTYDASAAVTATAAVWPSTANALNLTVNNGGAVTIPFSRTVGGTLTMLAGDINISSNTLTLGTAATTPGTLTYTSGNIQVTSGSFVRWFNTTGLPTAAGTGIGFYPISAGGANRNVALSFSSATALSTGGTIGVGHTDATGLATVSVTDGSYTIDKRTNASWAFTTGNGIAASGTINVKLTGAGLFTAINPANLRVMQASAVVGTHAAGAGVSANRTGLALTDLAVPYYIGAAAADIGSGFVAITTGNWSTGSTWSGGVAPTIVNDAYINPGVTVTADAATNAAKSLTILGNGTLLINATANTVTIDSTLTNNGNVVAQSGTLAVNGNSGASGITNNTGASFNVLGGTVNLGPTGGSNKPFINGGSLIVANGALNINGNYTALAISSTNQAGGTITVDGNAAGVAANSVPNGTPIVNLLSPNLSFSGGTFTVVDPHAGTGGTNTFVYNNGTTVAAVGTHLFRFGNGTSTDAGGQAPYNFSVNPNVGSGKFVFNNVEVNAGTATNSAVIGGGTFGVMGNFVVNSGGEFRINSGVTLYLNGNLTVNTGGTFTSTTGTSGSNVVYFGNYATGSVVPATNPQTVSGTGVFRNFNSATPTANFSAITISNTSMVTFNMPNDSTSYSGAVTFVAGATGPSRIKMPGTTRLIEVSGGSVSGASQTNGWIYGRQQKAASGSFNHTFSIGDSAYYTPVVISAGTITTAGAVWAKSTPVDHPQIATSGVIATKSINRYYTITPMYGIVVTPGTVAATFNWVPADVDPGINIGNIRAATYNAAAWAYPPAGTPASTSYAITGMGIVFAGDYQMGEFCTPLNIANPPTNQVACVGTSATFTVGLAASAVGVTYQWQKGSTAIAGATNASYTIPAAALTDAGSYSVIIASTCSAATPVTSAAATLTVNTPASISTQPAAQSICHGSPVTFSVTAAGTGITYQWQKNGTNITGATNATYTIPAVTFADTANYTVTVIGASPCGNVTSANAKLTVLPLPLTIAAGGSTTFCSGGSVLLRASNNSGLTYQWQLGGINITGATDSTYTANAFGTYTAVITNTANSCVGTSNAITTTSGSPVSTITPAGTASVCTGDSILLTGPSTGGLTFQWQLNGTDITGATNQTYKTKVAGSYTLKVFTTPTCSGTSAATVVSLIPLPTVTVTPGSATTFCTGGSVTLNTTASGVTYQWLRNGTLITPGGTVANYSATTNGSYRVIVTSTTTSCKDTSAATTVTVNPLPTANITTVGSTTFCAGSSVLLKTNSATGLQYQWIRGGTNITGATDSTYTATVAGSYTVKVTNASTTCFATSGATTVTVNPLPNVTVAASNGTTICSGVTTNLCVPSATGLTYQWALNGTNITGATSACYGATLPGSYVVTVTNTSTTCTATATATTIVVNPAPTASASATGNTTVCDGDTVHLTSNTGAGLTYVWYKNGTAIPGATTTAYAATTTGSYTVNVSNANCTVTSNAIAVTVNPKPTAVITYTTPITFCEGGAVVLTGVSASGNTYQWQNNASAISGATDNYFLASQTGSYSVVVTNSFGCSVTTAATLVVVNPLPQPVISRNGTQLSTGSFVSYQWYLNSQPIPGATSQGYTVLQNGAYYVRVTDANGCTNYSAVEFFNNLGVGTIVKAEDIKIFPNPVHEYVNIEAPVKVNIMIRDLQGRVLLSQKDVKQVDLSRFADGVYMILILDEDGQLLKMEKLFKSE